MIALSAVNSVMVFFFINFVVFLLSVCDFLPAQESSYTVMEMNNFSVL